jgi:hypothetical protein
MSRKKSAEPDEGAERPEGRADLSIVTSLSLLMGGLASYPALQEMVEGRVGVIPTLTRFLAATLIALIGLGVIASLFRAFSAAHHEAEAEKTRVAAETAAGLVAGLEHEVVRGGDISSTMDEAEAVAHAERVAAS